jgi:hypothetical protein
MDEFEVQMLQVNIVVDMVSFFKDDVSHDHYCQDCNVFYYEVKTIDEKTRFSIKAVILRMM